MYIKNVDHISHKEMNQSNCKVSRLASIMNISDFGLLQASDVLPFFFLCSISSGRGMWFRTIIAKGIMTRCWS
jgi:hypothetical protein